MTDAGDIDVIVQYYESIARKDPDYPQYQDMFVSACAVAASVRAEANIDKIEAFAAIPTLTEKDRTVGPTDYTEYMRLNNAKKIPDDSKLHKAQITRLYGSELN